MRYDPCSSGNLPDDVILSREGESSRKAAINVRQRENSSVVTVGVSNQSVTDDDNRTYWPPLNATKCQRDCASDV